MNKNAQDEGAEDACMACSCPCEAHKEHNHPIEKKHEYDEKNVCMACSCPCDEHKEHTHQ